MKAMSIARRFASILALLMAIMMLFAACTVGGGNEDPDNPSSQAQDTTDESTPEDESKVEDTNDKNESKNSQGNQQTQTDSGKKNAFDDAKEDGIWKNLKNKNEVHVLMWRKYTKSEQKLVDQYTKMTGVKIKTTVTTEQEYPTKLVSMVSGKNSPDVVCFSAGNFPGLVTKSLQPLDTKYFQLDSDCWNKKYMDAYKINGVYFGVAMPMSWSCEDCTYVTYYSPAVLKACDVTTMPIDLYNDGKWNWDKQAEIVRKVKEANKGYTGLALQSTDLFMLSAGADFASYDGSKYTNNLGKVGADSLLTRAWQQVATLNADGVLGGWELTAVQQGRVGLFSAISYGLYNEGKWFENVTGGYANLQAVPLAGPTQSNSYTPVRPKCWGVPKGAKNPEGAAYFLRYFLDVSEFDQSSTFYNKQFETVYKKITTPTAKKAVMHGWGVSDYVQSSTYSGICNALKSAAPANVNTVLNSKKGNVATGINRANKDLARIK